MTHPRTGAEVAARVSEKMKAAFGGMGRYMPVEATRATMIPTIVETCVSYCAGHGDFPPISDGGEVMGVIELLYEEHTIAGMEKARAKLRAITSVRMLEALAASVEGAAWSVLAGFELRVRRHEASDWRFDASGHVVFDPPKVGAGSA